MRIGILTTGVGVLTTININYLPQYLYYIAATQLTGLKVNVGGDGVITDIDGVGLNGLSGIRRFGAVANSYLIPLSNGFIPNKVVDLTFTNSAAQTPDIYGFSLAKGSAYTVTRRQTMLANSSITFTKFVHLVIGTPATTDIITIGYVDGHVQQYESTEFLAIYTLYSNETDSYCIDNIDFMIDYVTYIPTTNRTAYVTTFAQIGEVI